MTYSSIRQGIFLSRPNRFLAQVEVDGKERVCHVKNTGRCRELLLPGAKVLLQEVSSGLRKTSFDLIAVYKGSLLVNLDSQAPNRVAADYLPSLFPGLTYLKPEVSYGSSRFDFYLETSEEKGFVEVKGVTLEEDGAALFPDAPTERGIKHLRELCQCRKEGYFAGILFVVQMKPVRFFSPNYRTHPAFGQALCQAKEQGVALWAVDCLVTETSILPADPVEIIL